MSHEAYIGFGANLGDCEATFLACVAALNAVSSTRVKNHSRLYETEPVGISDGGAAFLNAAIAVETDLSPEGLIAAMRQIERELGKSPFHRSDRSRTVDLDLLLYEERIIQEQGLEIPHPRMHLRAFVLTPLAEIAPQVVHPVERRTVKQLLTELSVEEKESVKQLDSLRGT
ncbi:MAG TPA: 2-amino-4-hydroxy-6-hydroxymethyldihydropteridine diphosphokinase [Desulfomonilaceae bacterium]|nr:2-amino-4-hydroxy-6-hydroxymethyldihydropteridine diphosphokinase [Desulfomonilaceae bacterium]